MSGFQIGYGLIYNNHFSNLISLISKNFIVTIKYSFDRRTSNMHIERRKCYHIFDLKIIMPLYLKKKIVNFFQEVGSVKLLIKFIYFIIQSCILTIKKGDRQFLYIKDIFAKHTSENYKYCHTYPRNVWMCCRIFL